MDSPYRLLFVEVAIPVKVIWQRFLDNEDGNPDFDEFIHELMSWHWFREACKV